MKRPVSALAVATALLALTGCTPPGASHDGKDEPPSCGQCEPEVATLKSEVEGLSTTQQVGRFRYNSDTNAGGGPSLIIDLVAKGDAKAALDKVFEAAWKSRVTPLETVIVNVGRATDYKTYDAQFYGNDRDGYENKWGPRPVK